MRLEFDTVRQERLFANSKKHTLGTDTAKFLGYVVSGDGIRVDEEKIKAIQKWAIPPNVHEVHSFLGLMTFYMWLILNFYSLAAPLSDCLK